VSDGTCFGLMQWRSVSMEMGKGKNVAQKESFRALEQKDGRREARAA